MLPERVDTQESRTLPADSFLRGGCWSSCPRVKEAHVAAASLPPTPAAGAVARGLCSGLGPLWREARRVSQQSITAAQPVRSQVVRC